MKSLKGIAAIVLAGLLFAVLQIKIGSAPPVGNFLDPFTGFWQNAENGEPRDIEFNLDELEGKVSILYDTSRVPHIFAENDKDLYFAQGYITARDRLWQMEFQTMAAAGRISEIVGPVAVNFDLYQRRMGMVYGARQSLDVMMSDPRTKTIIEAYTRGINAYISGLQPRDYPFEYKLLGYAPEKWTPLKCALLLKQMTKTLNGGSDDYYLSNILAKYNKDIVYNLFPDRPFRASPVIPAGTAWDFQPLPLPEPPKEADPKALSSLEVNGYWRPERSVPGIGSNNWAISGSKTASGHPILANDPHLNLTLPSLWYQVQLSSPGVNVCGVSLPGAPGVIIGFNRSIAWGVTNVDPDVLDFYRIRFKDEEKNEYWLDSAWIPLEKKVETVKVRGAEEVRDTVLYTRFGPVVYEEGETPFEQSVPQGYAAKWIAHEGGNEVLTFYELNRAENYEEYVMALRHYVAPAQNFVFASAGNDIAMWVNGKFPLKWKNQGKFLLDGTRSSNDWQGWIPHAHNPHVKDPPRGFVSSANQFSADTSYPYYLNWEYTQPGRAIRINELLAGMQKATTDSIRLMQSDSYKKLAEWALPAMLQALDTTSLKAEENKARLELLAWDYRNAAAEIAPSLFEIWWEFLEKAIWGDEFAKAGERPMRYPGHDRSIHLLNREKEARWFDNVNTAAKEGLRDAATQSFRKTIDSLQQTYGQMGEAWQWGNVKGTHIAHILGQDALGSEKLLMGGGKGTINALNDHNGPSWRMVVEMGDTINAYGIYPGGQSGNPGSPWYDNMIETWRQGKLHKLVFLTEPDEDDPGIVSTMTLQ
ncbi:penicillin acylase family protein [Anseongella ginsenosidimutans]|nr:penicillin acylase family protein [Anseongella ginsenosidimutans]QEC50956.1 penicillin acylase family protein [Anseongella ginsenosidimutans]